MVVEKQCVLATASQLNRASVEEIEFDHSHISGGLSKIQTADNVIGIFIEGNERTWKISNTVYEDQIKFWCRTKSRLRV